jgi:hypothetical protein
MKKPARKTRVEMVTAENTTPIGDNVFGADAIELGLDVGAPWPAELRTTLGNKKPLVKTASTKERASYRQKGGPVYLNVYNEE